MCGIGNELLFFYGMHVFCVCMGVLRRVSGRVGSIQLYSCNVEKEVNDESVCFQLYMCIFWKACGFSTDIFFSLDCSSGIHEYMYVM